MGSGGDPRTVRQAVKRIEKLALDTPLSQLAFTFEIDVRAPIPVNRITYPRFHEQQWPRVLARFEPKRDKFATRQARIRSVRPRRRLARNGPQRQSGVCYSDISA